MSCGGKMVVPCVSARHIGHREKIWTTTIFGNFYREYLREFCIMHTAPAVTHNNIYEFGAMKIWIYEISLTIGKPQKLTKLNIQIKIVDFNTK